jgi:ribosomal protein S7
MDTKEKADYLRERGKTSPALKIAKTAFDHASKMRLKHTPKHQILEWITNNIVKIDECTDTEENKDEAREVCYAAYESVQKRIGDQENEAGGNAAGNAKQSKDGYKRTLKTRTLGNENSFYSGSDDDLDYS